jgi:hypothetical protein
VPNKIHISSRYPLEGLISYYLSGVEFFAPLAELVDGDLPPPRADRLRDLLRDAPLAQDLYLDFMKLHAHPRLAYVSGSGPVDMPGGSSMPLKPLSVSPFEPAVGGVIDEEPGGTVGAISSGRFWPSSPVVGWALAVFFAIVLAFVSRPSEPRKVPIAARPSGKVDVSKGVAVVVRAAGVRWESSDGRVPKEGDVLPQWRLKVLKGRAMLSMLNGVSVIVEGPADIELLSVDRITCHRGKLRTRMPERSVGYAIEFWFFPEAIGLASLVSMVAPKDATHHLSLVELTSSNSRTLFRAASI